MRKSVFILIIVSLVARLIGYTKEFFLAFFYGTSYIVDSYIIAITIPIVVFEFFSEAIRVGFIPKYVDVSETRGTNEANKFMNGLINLIFIITLVLVIILVLFTKQFVMVFASGFEGAVLKQAIKFTRIASFAILFSGFSSIYKAYLNANGNYTFPAITLIPLNIIIIISIYLSSITNPETMILGFVVGYFVQFLILFIFVHTKNYKYIAKTSFCTLDIKNMLSLIYPIFFSVAVTDINKIINRTIASNLGEGAISSINYASKFNSLIQSIFVLAITTVIFPIISKLASKSDYKKMSKIVKEAIEGMAIFLIPITLFLFSNSEFVVSFVFGRGAFDVDSIESTASALKYYSLGMFFVGLKQILNRVYYSLNDIKYPVYNSFFDMGLNIILNLLVFYFTDFGIAGLALSTSISSIVSVIFLLFNINKKTDFNILNLIKNIAIISALSVVIIALYNVLFNNMINIITNETIVFGLSVLIAFVVYFFMLVIFRLEGVKFLTNYI